MPQTNKDLSFALVIAKFNEVYSVVLQGWDGTHIIGVEDQGMRTSFES